jgi:opacity protein-like surface antigen
LISLVILAGSAPLLAQGFEVTPFFGGRFGGGIPVTPFKTGDGFLVAGLDLKTGAAFGVTFDASLTENFQLEFLWSRQDSTVRGTNAVSTEKVDLADTNVDQYHFNLLYQTGGEDDGMRPFILAGLGASRFAPSGGFDAQTHFSFGFGGGVKLFFTENLGLRIQGRWAPTRIGKDDFVFCAIDGCFEVDASRNVSQGELTGGLIVRF